MNNLRMTDLIEVRATINLPGLRCGHVASVDPSVPYVRDCLAQQYLVPTGCPTDDTQSEFTTKGVAMEKHIGDHVLFVPGKDEEAVIVHVLKNHGGTLLDLQLSPGQVERSIPLREKSSDGEDLGRTWHSIG